MNKLSIVPKWNLEEQPEPRLWKDRYIKLIDYCAVFAGVLEMYAILLLYNTV